MREKYLPILWIRGIEKSVCHLEIYRTLHLINRKQMLPTSFSDLKKKTFKKPHCISLKYFGSNALDSVLRALTKCLPFFLYHVLLFLFPLHLRSREWNSSERWNFREFLLSVLCNFTSHSVSVIRFLWATKWMSLMSLYRWEPRR